jgi:hypothetical protein
MGKPTRVKHVCLYNVGYVEREPCEVKHLSSMRKIKQVTFVTAIPLVVASERGPT